MPRWGRTIRTIWGKSLSSLIVKMVNINTSASYTLTESGSFLGHYTHNDLPDGKYNLYANETLLEPYSPIILFNSPVLTVPGGAGGAGYGEGPYGEGGYGER